MPTWLLYLLVCLATYRCTRLLIKDQLFAPLVARLQTRSEGRFEARFERRHGQPPPASDRWRSSFAYLLSCPWCVSAYTGALLITLTDCGLPFDFADCHGTSVPLPWLLWAAASAFTGWAFSAEQRLFDHDADDDGEG